MFIKPTMVSWRLWKSFGTPQDGDVSYFDIVGVNECVDEYTQVSSNFDSSNAKASALKTKFGALTVLLMIYLCLYGSLIALGILGLILACFAMCCAKLCDFEADGAHIGRNCACDEFGHFVKGYLILN